jgi:2-polyprenyl-6-methoxyphenol hydroxylase-like FAD-dependent oxidoreductase
LRYYYLWTATKANFMRDERTEVLVVGAGPVGLFSALLLAEAGLQVNIIDREQRTAARSYACALHSQTLRLFARLNLAAPLLEIGHRVSTVAFYDHETRRAEINLTELQNDFPFLLILPQNAVEALLEQRLRKAGVNVHWNHRLDTLQDDTEEVLATVEELAGTSTGYIVPHWEMVVKRRSEVRAQFVLGADGHHSTLRQRLGIESQRVAGPFFFAAYEFESEPTNDELRVVLDNTSTNVLWPLPGNKCRWTFQLTHPHSGTEFPEKERRAVRLSQPAVDEKIKDYVLRAAKNRAPWFSASVKEIDWCTEVVFEHSLARQFGRNRSWLVGDAAHQTGPVGVQSMNVGFAEAETIAGDILKVLRQTSPPALLETYDRHWQAEWKRLLGLTGGLKTRNNTNPWVRDRAARILPCLPASDGDLTALASQLSLDYP